MKFRTASIILHTQPFKYLVNEEPIKTEITEETSEIKVINQGLEPSKAIMTLHSEGLIEVSINGLAQFQVDIGEESDYITVDAMTQECYRDSTLTLKNRNMIGEFPILRF